MDLQLKGKSAIVTGGSAGIGLAIAQALVREGVNVVVPGRNAEKLEAALRGFAVGSRARAGAGTGADSGTGADTGTGSSVAAVAGAGGAGSVRGVVADVGTAAGADALIAAVPDTDILINNLGIYEPKPFAEIGDADWLRLFEVNVLSGVRLTRHYFPRLLARGWGRVIFISSESGIMTPPEMIHYGVTKSSQLAISRGLSELTRGTGVTVNTVMPGPTRSDGVVDFLKGISTNPDATPAEAEREFFEKHRSSSLLQRMIEPEEIASLVAYVASPLSAATNGAALRAEGGLLRSIA